jgi:hypothetical protein
MLYLGVWRCFWASIAGQCGSFLRALMAAKRSQVLNVFLHRKIGFGKVGFAPRSP